MVAGKAVDDSTPAESAGSSGAGGTACPGDASGILKREDELSGNEIRTLDWQAGHRPDLPINDSETRIDLPQFGQLIRNDFDGSDGIASPLSRPYPFRFFRTDSSDVSVDTNRC